VDRGLVGCELDGDANDVRDAHRQGASSGLSRTVACTVFSHRRGGMTYWEVAAERGVEGMRSKEASQALLDPGTEATPAGRRGTSVRLLSTAPAEAGAQVPRPSALRRRGDRRELVDEHRGVRGPYGAAVLGQAAPDLGLGASSPFVTLASPFPWCKRRFTERGSPGS